MFTSLTLSPNTLLSSSTVIQFIVTWYSFKEKELSSQKMLRPLDAPLELCVIPLLSFQNDFETPIRSLSSNFDSCKNKNVGLSCLTKYFIWMVFLGPPMCLYSKKLNSSFLEGECDFLPPSYGPTPPFLAAPFKMSKICGWLPSFLFVSTSLSLSSFLECLPFLLVVLSTSWFLVSSEPPGGRVMFLVMIFLEPLSS